MVGWRPNMPTYSYKCSSPKCEIIREDQASMSSFKEHTPACEICGSVCTYIYVPSVPQIAFKDGPSGSWVGKGLRFKKHREKESAAAKRRQDERFGDAKQLIPNYKGEETGSWKEAQRIAADKNGAESAATYSSLVKTEKPE